MPTMAQQQASSGSLLSDATCQTVLSSTDLDRSRRFWEGTCGLVVKDRTDEGIMLECGNNTSLYIYHRDERPRANNTVCTFEVPDLEAKVRELRDNGVRFEEYDQPGLKTKNGIASSPDGSWRAAWFKDPDGNICALGDRSGR